jgi:hypothetical protein
MSSEQPPPPCVSAVVLGAAAASSKFCAIETCFSPPSITLQAHALSTPPHEFSFDKVFTDIPSAISHHCSGLCQVPTLHSALVLFCSPGLTPQPGLNHRANRHVLITGFRRKNRVLFRCRLGWRRSTGRGLRPRHGHWHKCQWRWREQRGGQRRVFETARRRHIRFDWWQQQQQRE